jgi:hypothetical protein
MLERLHFHRLAPWAVLTAAAALSLLLPFSPVYDTWAWLVWGREIGDLDLDTSGGPSWKPLPVVFTTLFGFAGDAAPELWLVVARGGWLAAAALAWRLAVRLAPTDRAGIRTAAGAIAAAGVLLLDDPFTSWLRQFAGGLSEPLLVALVLGAVDRELAGRRSQALTLGFAAALLRPEAWPFLALYGAWLWRGREVPRATLAAVAAAVPVLWLLPDLVGSGDALTGAGRARSATGAPLGEAIEAIGRTLDLAPWAMWPAAAYAAARTWISGERAIPLLAGLAAAWIGVVAVLAALGYAGLPRFGAPAAALACVLGAVGLVVLFEELRRAQRLAERLRTVGLGVLITRDRFRRAALGAGVLVALLAGLAIQGALRVAEVPGQYDSARDFDLRIDDLDETVGRVGRETFDGCGAVDITDFLAQTALAWDLGRPLDSVGVRTQSLPRRGILVAGVGGSPPPGEPKPPRAIAVSRSWTLYAVSCTAADSARPARIAGVAGARR